MSKWCYNYDSGEYEDIDEDGYNWTRGEYSYNWDDSEYKREREERTMALRMFGGRYPAAGLRPLVGNTGGTWRHRVSFLPSLDAWRGLLCMLPEKAPRGLCALPR